jgi:asparagine synthase (glutamine-hydrolysing)
LFYGESSHGLAFGSEIKAVLAASGVNSALDDQSLSEYLWYGNTFESRTFYRGVRALEPGHWLIIEDGKQRLGAWWRVEEWLQQPLHMRAMGEAAVWLREVLDRAVARQLVADVPVRLFLSGGVDSSAIAAAAMQNCSEPLTSYTATFDYDGAIDELPKAARVGRHLGHDHHEMRVDGSRLESTLVALSRAHDEPFADAANIPLYLMCKQLQGHAKVVLQGDGGDELFAGYRRYAVLHNVRWWRLWPRALSGLMRGGGTWGHRFARMADSVGHPDPALRMSLLLTTETLQNPPWTLFLPERRRELATTTDPFVVYRRAAERFRDFDPVEQMLLTDLTVQLPSQFLTKVDRATMAAGIEARVPLLDEEVVKLALAIPAEWKVRGLRKKIMLRESQRGRLPDDILDGPKTGFGVPYEHWVSGPLYPWARDLILDPGYVQRFGFDRGAVDRLLGRHHEHRDPRGFMVWKLFQLALWHHHGLRDS